jgi:hypothetical protein
MLPLLLMMVASSSGNGFLSGLFNFFNQFFVAPDPPQLVSVSGNAFDLPNSNIVEVPPTLPSLEMPINPFSNSFIPQSNLNLIENNLFPNPTNFNLIENNLFSNTAVNQGIPPIPNFSP